MESSFEIYLLKILHWVFAKTFNMSNSLLHFVLCFKTWQKREFFVQSNTKKFAFVSKICKSAAKINSRFWMKFFCILSHFVRGKIQTACPNPIRKDIVIEFHDLLGLSTVDRTISNNKEFYWFKCMKPYEERHISMCFECPMNKIYHL